MNNSTNHNPSTGASSADYAAGRSHGALSASGASPNLGATQTGGPATTNLAPSYGQDYGARPSSLGSSSSSGNYGSSQGMGVSSGVAQDPAQIERQIEQQRSHIEEVISQLSSKLNPEQMLREATNWGKETGKELPHQMMEAIKANPMAAAITAAGLWYLYSHRPDAMVASDSAFSPATGQGVMAGGYTGAGYGGYGGYSHANETDTSMRERASEKLAHGKEVVREKAHATKDRAALMLEENPFGAAAIAMAVGAFVGAMLPVTNKEHELLGERSQQLKDKARDLAHQGGQQLKEATSTSAMGSSTSSGMHAASHQEGATRMEFRESSRASSPEPGSSSLNPNSSTTSTRSPDEQGRVH